MAFTNISLNLTALENLTPINITVDETTLLEVVNIANDSTNNNLIFATLFTILIIIYLTLSDKTPLQDFGYSDVRAINLALSVCVLIGVTIVSVGWSPNFKAVGMFITMWVISSIIIYIIENKE
ncbi:unnamed protein product [marine sediment metagenome]|uniref:Uncharacterized protein n=1 Tax=marine sediment metagenome TaxID=412755 RepID=X1FJI8_9ZZZZ